MKAISTGNTFMIYDDNMRTYDKLPAQSYVVRFSKQSGFFLEKYSDIEIKESKVYGVHTEKVNKVLNAFDRVNRSLGVILSGDKGIGKSLFAKMLSAKAIENGLPLIIVDTFIPGIASYIEEIEQEVVVLFDEFDKTFGSVRASDGEADPQAAMLSLFDGISQGKKLFVITCNELSKLNDYLVNRPGRFHYHFRFEYPTDVEIREYLQDKVEEEYWSEIDNVINFSKKVNLNYDCLRAIAFELNTGESFKTAIKDLNIVNLNKISYNISLHYSDGTTLTTKNEFLDLFSRENEPRIYMYDKNGYNIVDITFSVRDCIYSETGTITVNAENLVLDYDEDYKDKSEKLQKLDKPYLTITRNHGKELHYAV